MTVTEDQDTFRASYTLKGDGAFYSPWLVMEASTLETLHENMKSDETKEILKTGAALAKGYYELAQQIPGEAKPQGGGGSKPTGSRPGPKDHPDGKTEFCEHGQMTFKSGVSQKTDKPWRAFDCPQGVCDRKWDRS